MLSLRATRRITPRSLTAGVLLAGMLWVQPAAAEDWARFRGPNGLGVSPSTGLPVEFGPQKNLVWEVSVPFGRSSPAITGDSIFLTAVLDDRLVTLALDRGTGKTRWRREFPRDRLADLYSSTDSATPSPVSDGASVYAFFHEAGLVSYEAATGKERWRMPLGPFRNFYGVASSPVLAGDTLLLLCDQAQGSFLLALDKKSGRELWRRNRPARLESYSTPVLYPNATQPQAVIVSGSRWVDAYALASGKSLWTLGGVGSAPISSPVLVGDTLFLNAPNHAENGWPPFAGLVQEHDGDGNGELSKAEVEGTWLQNHFGWLDANADGSISAADWDHIGREVVNDSWGAFAIRLSAEGQPRILWNTNQSVPQISTPLVYNKVFYMVKGGGVLSSIDAQTGKLLKRERLEGIKAKIYASPVAADGKVYISTMDGEVAVLKAGPEWTVLAINQLGEEIWATPAIVDGHLYVRTKEKLFSFAQQAPPVEAAEAAPAG